MESKPIIETNPKELVVDTPAPTQYVEGDNEEAQGNVVTSPKKNTVNIITVDEVKFLLAQLENRFKIALEAIRKGQYVLVDTDEYPTLEDFLASDGEQGTVYLYPVGNEDNNYYQFIWETDDWVPLGSTGLDLSGYIKGTDCDNQAEYEAIDPKDPDLYYFVKEEE